MLASCMPAQIQELELSAEKNERAAKLSVWIIEVQAELVDAFSN